MKNSSFHGNSVNESATDKDQGSELFMDAYDSKHDDRAAEADNRRINVEEEKEIAANDNSDQENKMTATSANIATGTPIDAPDAVVTPTQKPKKSWLSYFYDGFVKFNLPIILIFGLVLGILYPPPGMFMKNQKLNGGICFNKQKTLCIFNSIQYLCIAGVFFLSGLVLDTAQAKIAIKSPKAFLMGLFMIIVLTPVMSFPVATSALLRDPPEFAFGLASFFAVPTTLNVGVAVTKLANGNFAFASLLTVTSNFIGVFTVPFIISWILPLSFKDSSEVKGIVFDLDPAGMVVQLIFAILIPMIIGKLIRDRVPHVPAFTNRHKVKISVCISIFIAIMAWMQASGASASFRKLTANSIFSAIFVFFCVHLYYFIQNYFIAVKIMKVPIREAKAMVIMGSQKSTPVCIAVLSTLPSHLVPKLALAIAGIIFAQILQTLLDSIIAVRWAEYSQKWENQEAVKKSSSPLQINQDINEDEDDDENEDGNRHRNDQNGQEQDKRIITV